MTMGKRLLDELDRVADPGTASVNTPSGEAVIEWVDADRLGVKVRGVRVTAGSSAPLDERAKSLASGLRHLGERLIPVEVAPELGGAVLRTAPEEMRNNEFFELDLRGGSESELRRWRRRPGAEREGVDFVMTRDALERLVDELSR